jgi:hypothetical protein
MATRNIWTEEKIARKEAAGDGHGEGQNYKPWLTTTDISSSGRARKVYGYKTKRVHHLLSDVEHNLFLALEWQQDIVDIREQFPLPREATLAVAEKAQLRHPYYPGSSIPTVMTVDFLVTKDIAGKKTLVAFNAKRTEEAEEIASLEKLEIQRRALAAIGVEHHLVYHSDIPLTKIANIKWMRSGVIQDTAAKEEFDDYWEQTLHTFEEYFQRHGNCSGALNDFCAQFDELYGHKPGSGLRAARALMYQRVIAVDLSYKSLANVPTHSLQHAKQVLHVAGSY